MGNCNIFYKQTNIITNRDLILNKTKQKTSIQSMNSLNDGKINLEDSQGDVRLAMSRMQRISNKSINVQGNGIENGHQTSAEGSVKDNMLRIKSKSNNRTFQINVNRDRGSYIDNDNDNENENDNDNENYKFKDSYSRTSHTGITNNPTNSNSNMSNLNSTNNNANVTNVTNITNITNNFINNTNTEIYNPKINSPNNRQQFKNDILNKSTKSTKSRKSSKEKIHEIKLINNCITIQTKFRIYLKYIKSRNPLYYPRDGITRMFDFFFNLGNEGQYIGHWKNKVRNGFGIMIWSDGDDYTGMWNDDQMEGIGKFKNTLTGSTYEGYFLQDNISNYGIETWSNGSIYEGEYMDNKKNGLGLLKFDDGSYYKGEFQDNEINGYGSFYKKDGSHFQGYYVKNKLNGLGILTTRDNKVYHGEFIDNIKDGFGILYDKQKNKNRVYVGNWRKGYLEDEVVVIENKEIRKFYFKNSKKVREIKDYDFKLREFDKIAKELLNE